MGLTLAVSVALATGVTAAVTSRAQPAASRTRSAYTTGGVGGWLNDAPLGPTDGTDQYVQARVTGLTDGGQQAGFLVRYASRTSRIHISVSGTGWRIEPTGGAPLTGTFTHAAAGLLRVEAQGSAVRVRWNGTVVAERTVDGVHPGRFVVPTVRQARPGVTLTAIEEGTLPPAPPVRSVTGVTPRPAARTWWSGASSDTAANGRFGAWRGSAVQIGGTWNDDYEAQVNQWSICDGATWSRWSHPLDLAIGGIFHSRGETWAAAAKGSYDARWAAALTRIRTCWGTRDQGLLYLRFAQEMNLPGDWSVRAGEERSFVQAITRFSTLRYRILPRAKIVLCVNDGTDGSLGGLDVRKLWPGRDGAGRRVADVYGADSYNQWPHVTTAAGFYTKINELADDGSPVGIERHRQLAARLGVPFAICEWSNNGRTGSDGGGGESPAYVQLFHDWARAHGGDPAHPAAGQLLYEVQFNLWDQFQFWPATLQPRTAAAYRALTWGR